MSLAEREEMLDPKVAFWRLLRLRKAPTAIIDILEDEDFPPSSPVEALPQIFPSLDRWCAAGLIHVVGMPKKFIMADNARAMRTPPLVEGNRRTPDSQSVRQRIWNALGVFKSLPHFELSDLVMAAEVDGHAALRFLNDLQLGGFVIRLESRAVDGPRWKVVRRTGPTHPAVEYRNRRPVALIDPQTGAKTDLTIRPKNFGRSI